jgi:hypothetical protein
MCEKKYASILVRCDLALNFNALLMKIEPPAV